MELKISAPERVHLPADVLATIDEVARADYPHEACGLLIGRVTPAGTEVERAEMAANLASDRLADRYRLDPDDFRRIDEAARRDGLDVVGIWHTHPDHPARPSATDLESAWPGYSYLIVAVTEQGVAERRSWRLEGDAFNEQDLTTGEGDTEPETTAGRFGAATP